MQAVKLLIIDDNPDDRTLYKRALRGYTDSDFSFIEASTGDNGMKALNQELDCVLLDYSLPGRDGIGVLKQIKSEMPNLPVIMLTGQGNESVAVQAMKEGAQDYIVKSTINEYSLYRVIMIAIEHHQMKGRVDKQQQALAVFTRALAHDLQEPIRTIQSFLTLVMQDGVDAFSKRTYGYLKNIQSASNSMANLVEAVHTYTKLESSATATDRCNMPEIVSRVCLTLHQLIHENNAQILFENLPDVHGNAPHIEQLIQNLIHNALRYSNHDQTVIKITAQQDGEWCTFSVHDNGPGIDKSYLEDIFKPFARFALSEQKGAGIGLSTCKKIVEQHGGKIWAEPNSEHDGAVFHFTLPSSTTSDEAEGVDQQFESSATVKEKALNILLVEDNEADVELTRILLLEQGELNANLHVACHGQEAMTFLQSNNAPEISVALVDINMPVMNGFQFLEHVKQNDHLQDIPIIICSTSQFEEDMEKAKSLGASGYIVKPATIEKFQGIMAHTDEETA